MIIVGSETTATTLANVLYHLIRYPHVLGKLQRLIDDAMPTRADWDYEKVKAVTYLDDIINETLRVRPALVSGGYRVTPAEGLQVDEQFIPGDVNIFVPAPTIHRDPRYWKKPDEFLPERFGELREEIGTDGAPYIPFNLGTFLAAPMFISSTFWKSVFTLTVPGAY